MTVSVLIVEDSDFMRDMLRDIIDDEFEVVGEAEDGEKGVEAFQEKRPDVVMMDVVMPNLDGIGATAKIKEEDPGSKVIMCTSVGQEGKMKEAVSVGADAYITKPFEDEVVLKAINDVMSQ